MKKNIIALIITILFLSSPAYALYRVTDFIGGCSDCADAIDGARFNAKTKPVYVIVTTTPEHATYPSKEFAYLWDSDAGCSEVVPDSIIPDTNASGGCLMLLTPGQAADIVADSVKDTHIDWGTGSDQVSAVDIPIADGGSLITGTEVETALQENRGLIDTNTGLAHAESHTVVSHSDTTATGSELETLTDTSDASGLHNHTTANLNDTTATGTNLNTLTDDSMADALHRQSELSSPDGTQNQVILIDNNGDALVSGGLTISTTNKVGLSVTSTETDNLTNYGMNVQKAMQLSAGTDNNQKAGQFGFTYVPTAADITDTRNWSATSKPFTMDNYEGADAGGSDLTFSGEWRGSISNFILRNNGATDDSDFLVDTVIANSLNATIFSGTSPAASSIVITNLYGAYYDMSLTNNCITQSCSITNATGLNITGLDDADIGTAKGINIDDVAGMAIDADSVRSTNESLSNANNFTFTDSGTIDTSAKITNVLNVLYSHSGIFNHASQRAIGINNTVTLTGTGTSAQIIEAQKNQITLNSANDYTVTDLIGHDILMSTGSSASGTITSTDISHIKVRSLLATGDLIMAATNTQGVFITDLGASEADGAGAAITNASGIRIDKQTMSIATNNMGFWLNGDGTGADITLGDAKQQRIYNDGTNDELYIVSATGGLVVPGVVVASLPATCTGGAQMRATDSDDCSSGSGNGSLCICVAAGNAWALLNNY